MEFDISTIVVSVIGIAVTAGLGFLYKKQGAKVNKALDLLAYFIQAAKDRKLEPYEIEEIWRRIKDLGGKAE